MSSCANCGGLLYEGDRPYQIDGLACRDCQRSPAIQVRLLLEHARAQGFVFERAWVWALGEQTVRGDGLADFVGGRVRWPHDTEHRIGWKTVLATADSVRVWRECYMRVPASPEAKVLTNLLLAAA